MSTHGRSQSHGSGGWLSGTMEVISGMAPRPSTPQGLPHGKTARSLSAPNSPARSVPGNFPGINRLPSQDSLDRSIHNESGHGKSTAQIIKDLKHSNASLSAKQAGMEAKFMNQLSEVTRSFEDQRVKMDTDIRSLKKQLAHLDAYKVAADMKLKEKDAALSKVKEESAFQRHSISDLKNQLYQLQTELEDAQRNEGSMMPRGAKEEMQQLLSDNQEMARELAKMHTELRESERARREVERTLGYGKPPAPPSASGESPGGYYQKYQETHSELERHRKRLSVTITKVEGLEAEKQNLKMAHAKTVEELQEELVKQSEFFQQREQEFMSKIESQKTTDTQASVDLKRQIKQRDDEIVAMQDDLDQYEQKLTDLASQLSQAKQAAASQENYRRDEAEDLRILHDAQEEEIRALRKGLEESRKELEMRDEELQESNARLEKSTELSNSTEGVDIIHTELADTRAKLAAAESHLRSVKDKSAVEVEESRKQLLDLQQSMSRTIVEHEQQTKELKASLELLTDEKTRLAKQLEVSEKEKAGTSIVEDLEFSKLRSHWQEKAGAAHEAESLKSEIEIYRREIEIHRQRATEATENERVATGTVQELMKKIDSQQKALDEQEKIARDATSKLEEEKAKESSTKSQIDETGVLLLKAEREIMDLRKTVQSHESNAQRNAKQLREAQIALVALDDEKKTISDKHRDLMIAEEKNKESMLLANDEKLKAKEMEILDMKKQLEEIQSTGAEQITKVNDRLVEAESLEAAEIKRLRDQLTSLRAEIAGRIDKRNLDPTNRAIPVTPEANAVNASNPANEEMDTVVRSLTGENDALKTKLKDRDTTISALVRSSVSLEAQISNMKNELRNIKSMQSEEKKATDFELLDAEKSVSSFSPVNTEDIVALKKELKLAKQDASRWKLALEETGGADSDYRYQITMLHKELDESVERLKERDQAIENLVNQSMSQDAHVRDLKTRLSSLMKEMEKRRSHASAALEAEVERLQNETEMFAGQIIEQDEEIQNLRRRLQQREDQTQMVRQELSEAKQKGENANTSSETLEEMARLKKDLERMSRDLRLREDEVMQMQHKMQSGDQRLAEVDSSQISALHDELDELREANRDKQGELRDLRKQLWEMKQAAGEANDLKLELAQAKYAFDEYKRTQSGSVNSKEDMKTIENLKSEILANQSRIAELEGTMVSSSARQEQIDSLHKDIAGLQGDIARKSATIEKLSEDIKTKNAAFEKSESIKLKILGELSSTKDILRGLQGESSEKVRSITAFDQENSTLRREKEEVVKARDAASLKIVDLEKKIESLRDDANKGQDYFKDQMDRAQKERDASEKSLVDSYEKRISILSTEKEAAMDELRGELMATRSQKSDAADAMARQIKSLQSERDALRQQFDTDLHEYKIKLEKAQQARESSEKSLVDVHEKRISALTTEKETTIEGLRRELTLTQSQKSEEADTMTRQVKSLESEREALRLKFDTDLHELKVKQENEQQAREASEKSLLDGYEKSIAALTTESETTIDGLRGELTLTRSQTADEADTMSRQIKSLESERDTLRQQFETDLHEYKIKLENAQQAREASEKSLVDMYEKRISVLHIEKETAIDGLRGELTTTRSQKSDEADTMTRQVKSLESERDALRQQYDTDLQEYQVKLEKAQQARETSEKSLVDAYEKRISALNAEKETSIDGLRGELTLTRGQKSDEADSMSRQVKLLQSEKDSLCQQFEAESYAKNQQIYALQHTLHAQEQVVQNMRSEMDQLQSGMERATEKRRGDIEDLQQELMQLEGRALKQEREITALKMQQEESKLEHKAEVVRLKEALANMEIEGPLAKTMASLQNDDRMLQVRERLEQLKARNTALQEENLKLGGRLERKVIEIKSLEFEKSRAEELEHENHSLRRQVQELGSILEGARPKSSRSSSAKKLPPPLSQPARDDQTTEATSLVSEVPVSNTGRKEKPGKSKKGIKGLFKRREVTIIPEGEED